MMGRGDPSSRGTTSAELMKRSTPVRPNQRGSRIRGDPGSEGIQDQRRPTIRRDPGSEGIKDQRESGIRGDP
jgi:hypothetical protein